MMAHLFLYDNKIITFRIFQIEIQYKNYKTLFTLSSPYLIFPFLQHPSEDFRRVKSGEE